MPMDSDEHDEERENWPGPSSNSQATVPVQPLQRGPAANSQGPVASTNTGDEDCEYSSGRTVLYPDLSVLTNDEHWAMTPETHKYAAAAGSLFRDNGKWKTTRHLQFDTMPCVQRSLYLIEMTDDFGHTQVEVPKRI